MGVLHGIRFSHSRMHEDSALPPQQLASPRLASLRLASLRLTLPLLFFDLLGGFRGPLRPKLQQFKRLQRDVPLREIGEIFASMIPYVVGVA